MKLTNDIWKSWGRRFKNAIRENGGSVVKCAEALEMSESGVRHWLNGTREINLNDFFRLCAAGGVDPCLVLFGAPLMNQELREFMNKAAASYLEADPLSNPHYGALMTKIRRAKKP